MTRQMSAPSENFCHIFPGILSTEPFVPAEDTWCRSDETRTPEERATRLGIASVAVASRPSVSYQFTARSRPDLPFEPVRTEVQYLEFCGGVCCFGKLLGTIHGIYTIVTPVQLLSDTTDESRTCFWVQLADFDENNHPLIQRLEPEITLYNRFGDNRDSFGSYERTECARKLGVTLNQIVKLDPVALGALIEKRVTVNAALEASHMPIILDDSGSLGVLGLLQAAALPYGYRFVAQYADDAGTQLTGISVVSQQEWAVRCAKGE